MFGEIDVLKKLFKFKKIKDMYMLTLKVSHKIKIKKNEEN